MTSTFSGSYPIETRLGEIDRLHVQSAAMAPDTERMLDLIGIREGQTCLDIGCGPGGITGLLSNRVGPRGRVVGLDMNSAFLEHARTAAPANVEFILGDAYSSILPDEAFDLVHMRFVARTAAARSQTPHANGRYNCVARTRWLKPQLLSTPSRMGETKVRAAWRIQQCWSRSRIGEASLLPRPTSRSKRCPISAIHCWCAFNGPDDRLSAVYCRIPAFNNC